MIKTKKKLADLVTGANGFIGSYLVKALTSKQVISCGRPDCDYRQLDFGKLPPIKTLYHLAWSGSPASGQSELDEWQVNVVPSLQLLEKALEARVERVVFLSSAGAIIDDRPATTYGKAKLAVEEWLGSQANDQFKVSIFRATNAIGVNQHFKHGQGILPRIKQCLAEDRPLTLWGDSSKDYLDVRDLVAALVRADIQTARLEIYPLGSGVNLKTSEIVEMAMKAANKTIKVIQKPQRDGDPVTVKVKLSKIKRELGWSPQHDPRETIRDYFV